ncbi:hypothetical protein cypCar_00005278 [Cyprinus carpio]|nr:hypothetical protein cypCar_00005278 [Cyprinus carpio]
MNFLKNEQKRKPFMYVPLVMDTDFSTGAKLKKNKGYKKSRSKKLKTYIPTAKKMLSPKDLLMNDEKSILLVGKPGVGKTTVALEILRLWTEEKNIPVSYMFYFDEPLMRVFSQSPYPQNLKDLLFQKYISPDKAPDQVLENIKSNSENVFIIFDGIMDVTGNSVIKQLMEKELLKDAKVLTTCRPEAEDTGYLSDWRSYRVEVQGFNHKSIFEYFKWMLGTTDDIGALENPELFSLCSVPLYAFIVAACISVSPTEARNKPFTVTEMYVRIFRFCMKQHGHQDVEHLDKYIKDNKRDVINLALASYQAMLAKTVNLTDLDHEDKSVQNAFLTKQFWNPSTTSCKVYAFLHNTMQEFWAALYLILNPDKITNVLDKCQNNEDGKYLKYIMPFLSGLLSDNVVELIECLVPVEQIEATRVKYIQQIIDTFLYTKEQNQEGDCEQFVEADNILFVCRCLYEYQFPEACRLFLEKVQYELDLEDQRLDPYQCCVISYVANQAVHRKIDLDLTDCSITDPGLKLLLSSLKNLKFLRFSAVLRQPKDIHKIVKIVADLFILASESGGGKLRSLSAACSYSTFPFVEDSKYMQSYFLMDLFTQLKESSSWKITLPALKPILQVAPAVWTLDLQKLEKTFALTELLKLQAIRKSVELTSWSCEREKLRSFLNCLPYISHLWISPRFVRAALKEIYQNHAGHLIVKLVKSSANLINLCMRELDSTDCKALCFALHYSDGVKLNLLNSVIPNNETDSIVKLLHRVSDLRVDRKLLLNFLHASKDMEKQGYPASSLLTALNHKLDFSCNSSPGSGRSGQENRDLLTMSRMDFTAISSAIKTSTCNTELILYDCQADDSALEILFPILHKVHLHLGKSLLCQVLTLISNAPMAMSLQWASSLSKALGEELNLSGIPLNYRTCESLQLVLDDKEELTHLNLSYCQITDACLDLLLPHLHKIMILDLTGNDITDKGVLRLRKTLEENSFTKTICLCDNQITEMGLLVEEARFETQQADERRCIHKQNYNTKDLRSKSEMGKSVSTIVKTEDLIKKFEPELAVNNGKISYRFQWKTEGLFMCSATGLVFGLKGSGCVEYYVAHWDMRLLINTHYEPAGPLFDIRTPAGEICELHLPHCETHVDAIGSLSVVHIHSEDTWEFLSPNKISRTHIAVNVCRLSRYGIVHENNQNNKIINGQVLLFQEPDMSVTQQRLWVFLLPSNVPLSEIKEQQHQYVFIQTSSDCKLQINAKYTLISKKAKRVQPKEKLFEPLHAGNYHPTFEVFLDKDVTEVRIKIQLKIKESDTINFKNAWKRWIILKNNTDNHAQMRSEEHSNIQVNCKT